MNNKKVPLKVKIVLCLIFTVSLISGLSHAVVDLTFEECKYNSIADYNPIRVVICELYRDRF